MLDLVVVGGGPVGSRLAGKVAAAGYRVAVLERKKKFGEAVCCSGIIGRECVSAFGIEAGILRAASGARLYSPSGRLLHLNRDTPQAYIVDRARFDLAMVDRARQAGAEYLFDSPVTDIEADEGMVTVRCRGKSQLQARAAVLACGSASSLPRRLGLGDHRDFAVGAQAEVESAVDEIEVYFGRGRSPGFFAWLVPASPGRARVGLLARQGHSRLLQDLVAALQAEGKAGPLVSPPGYRAIPLGPLARSYAHRLLAVGDAAGQVKPTTGGGIYYGLLCADIAASTLVEALQGDDLSPDRLAAYERAWRRRLGREIKVGRWARRLFERLSDQQIDRLFDVVRTNGIDEALSRAPDLSFDWHSKALLRFLAHHMVSRALGLARSAFIHEDTAHGKALMPDQALSD